MLDPGIAGVVFRNIAILQTFIAVHFFWELSANGGQYVLTPVATRSKLLRGTQLSKADHPGSKKTYIDEPALINGRTAGQITLRVEVQTPLSIVPIKKCLAV